MQETLIRFVIQKEHWLPCSERISGISLPHLHIRIFGLRRMKILAPAPDGLLANPTSTLAIIYALPILETLSIHDIQDVVPRGRRAREGGRGGDGNEVPQGSGCAGLTLQVASL